MTEKTPANSRDLELLNAPAIATHFPVRFANGAEWSTLAGRCSACKGTIHATSIFGFVTRPFPNVAVVEALGVCDSCNLATPFNYRLHDDMSFSGPQGRGGWKRWQTRLTWRSRIQKAWRYLAGKISSAASTTP